MKVVLIDLLNLSNFNININLPSSLNNDLQKHNCAVLSPVRVLGCMSVGVRKTCQPNISHFLLAVFSWIRENVCLNETTKIGAM